MMGMATRITSQFGIGASAVLPGRHAPIVRQMGIGCRAAQGFVSRTQVQTLLITVTQLLAGIGQIQMGNHPGGNGGIGPFARAEQQRFDVGTGLLIMRDGIGVIAGFEKPDCLERSNCARRPVRRDELKRAVAGG